MELEQLCANRYALKFIEPDGSDYELWLDWKVANSFLARRIKEKCFSADLINAVEKNLPYNQ